MLDKTFSEISNGSPNHSYIHWFCWQNGVVSCTSVRCPVLNCIDPVYELGKCCPSCSSDKCVVEGRTYRSGDSFCLPSDPCQECHCIGSKATCAKRECPETRCRNPAFLAGKCCPECKGRNKWFKFMLQNLEFKNLVLAIFRLHWSA